MRPKETDWDKLERLLKSESNDLKNQNYLFLIKENKSLSFFLTLLLILIVCIIIILCFRFSL